jgi:hypothetical protein
LILSLLDTFDDILVQPFVPNGAVVALDIGVLLGLSGLDVLNSDALFLGPFSQFFTDVFGAIARREEGLLVGFGRLRSL